MKVLAIDPATKSGFAFKDDNDNIKTFGYSLMKYNKRDKLHYWYKRLLKLKDKYNPDVIIYETTNFNIQSKYFNFNHIISAGKLLGMIEMVFKDKVIVGYNNMTAWKLIPKTLYKERRSYVKKEDKKRISLDYVQNVLNIDCKDDDNRSDAVLLLVVGKEYNYLPKPKDEKFKKVKKQKEQEDNSWDFS